MRYEATFPLLLNIADQPTYFMSLKGADGLVKMYAMVNVQQYNIVETGGTVAECEANYRQALANNGLIQDSEAEVVPSDQTVVPGTISEIRSAVMNGNTYYFFRLGSGDQVFYRVNAAENPLAVILNVGDAVELVCAVAPEDVGVKATDTKGRFARLMAGSEWFSSKTASYYASVNVGLSF